MFAELLIIVWMAPVGRPIQLMTFAVSGPPNVNAPAPASMVIFCKAIGPPPAQESG